MKKRILVISFILTLILVLLPSCSLTANGSSGSLKAITKPYIGEYECVEARLGEKDFLEKYDYIKITLLDDEKLEVSYKTKGGKKSTFEGGYKVNDETREFTGEIGILGLKFREVTKIENGQFILTKNILTSTLVMKFKMK